MECRYCTKNPNYLVFADGNIYSIKKKKMLSPGMTTPGYLMVNIPIDGKKRAFRVHRLVAEAFLPNPENKGDVNHKNGVKTDNRIENLEWCTRSENILHAVRTGLTHNTKVIGMYSKSGELIQTFSSSKDAMRETGIDNNHIRAVCLGYRKSAGGYIWRDIE